MRPLISPDEAQVRLRSLFGGAFDASVSSPIAGHAVAALLYVGAVADEEPTTWGRPSTVYWQIPSVIETHTSDVDRAAWRDASDRGAKRVNELLKSWGVTAPRVYADTTRESIRDETWRVLHELGAMRRRTGVPVTSSKGVWALEPHFADLFDPALGGDQLEEAIGLWVAKHLDKGSQLKVAVAHSKNLHAHGVMVTLPDGTTRSLEPGDSSRILKGVIEEWAPTKLSDPIVLAISEPGNKTGYTSDQHILARLGVAIDASSLLPDALIADLDDEVKFWVIEAVASDGPITEQRKRELQTWAQSQRINPDHLRYLTAFLSRNAAPARKRLKDLAAGTYAWYLDEPNMELIWLAIDEHGATA